MRDGEIISRFDFLTSMIGRQAKTHFYESLRMDTLMQLLLDKGVITKKDLDAKFQEVQKDVKKKVEEERNKPKIIIPETKI